MNANSDAPLITVLQQALWRERERIRRAEAEIFSLESQLYVLGVELPLAAPAANVDYPVRDCGITLAG